MILLSLQRKKQIIDGGSTGSRLHIFEFVEEELASPSDEATAATKESKINGTASSVTVRCVRRGSSRADTPLSAFGRLASDGLAPHNPSEVAAHLLPSFEYAAAIVPPVYHNSTGVFYQATAGMRLLDESEQEAVYDALYQGLMQAESFAFMNMQRKDIATLSGEMEAYYGAVAANFLQGIIDTEMRIISRQPKQEVGGLNRETDATSENMAGHVPVGALDMGGSSTQIVYMADHAKLMKQHEAPSCINPQEPLQENDGGGSSCVPSEAPQLSDDHFFSTSYLSYGVDQFRERLWSTLIQERIKKETQNPDSCFAKIISNPCANKGFKVEWDGYTLIGSGDTKECIRQTRRLIPHPEIPLDYEHTEETDSPSSARSGVVGGVEHPPLRGKFLAMSLYFFTLDSLRVFSQPDEDAHGALNLSWPNPSIEELYNALDGLCSREWHGDMALQIGTHAFTREEVLPHRCLEAVYMVTLLKDGFGFHPSSRDITFTFLVDGSEVEWTLGMALAMNAEERQMEHNGREEDEGEQYFDKKTIDELFLLQGWSNSMFFGVTLPPTHCC